MAELIGGGAEQRGKTEDDGGGAPIYSREERARRQQLTHELATELAACHRVRKQRKSIGGSSCVAPAATREVALGLVLILKYLQNCHCINFANYSQIF